MKARIRKVIIGVSRTSFEAVIRQLGNEGVVQLSPWDPATEGVSAHTYAEMENSAAAILSAIEDLCADLNITLLSQPAADTGPVIFGRTIKADRALIDSIRAQADEVRNRRQQLHAERERLAMITGESKQIAALGCDKQALSRMMLCAHAFGTVKINIVPGDIDMQGELCLRQAGRYVLGITLAGNDSALREFLGRYGFEDRKELIAQGSLNESVIRQTKENVEHIALDLHEKENALAGSMDDITLKLTGLYETYFMLKTSIKVGKAFMHTADTRFITGWIDLADAGRLVASLHRACGESFFIHVFSREEMRGVRERVPVLLRNWRFFKAFEMIVKNAGIPDTKELDPTPVATIAYLLMFGVMFGDIGQGLVLSLAGLAMKITAKKKNLRPFFHDGGTILVAAGISAALFGALYGSVFSNEHIVPALWFHPMEHIMDLFFAAIMMGASFISLGLVMNIVNLYRHGELFECIFGIHGILGFTVYTGTLFMAARYAVAGTAPGQTGLLVVLALPTGIFLVRNIPAFFFFGQKKFFPRGVFEYVIASFVELMEMFSGFMGNTISFIRAGAFALSHAGLSITVYTLAGMAGPLLSAGSLAIIVTGNILIILLEGLVCGIQSMRLEYYEFFGKFFRGDGVEFAPFSFRGKQFTVRGVAK